MRNSVNRRVVGAVAGLAAAAMIVTGCSSTDNSASSTSSPAATAPAAAPVTVKDANGGEVTLLGPIAEKFKTLTPEQVATLGPANVGDVARGTRPSGVIYQQFRDGVIVAKNDTSPAFITWGKIRGAWNVARADDGTPAADGKTGSESPLGVPTSDETTEGNIKTSTFEHGKITFNTETQEVVVTVNGKVVPTE